MSRSLCPPAPAATPSSGLRLCVPEAAGWAGYRSLRGLLGHGNRVRALARDRNLACRKNAVSCLIEKKTTRTRTRLLRAQRTQLELGEQAVQLSPVR